MKRITEKLVLEICKKNKISDLKELKERKFSLDKKSTSKEYFNVIERLLLNLNEEANKPSIDFLIQWCRDTQVGFRDNFIIKLFDRNNLYILETINKYGLLYLNKHVEDYTSLYEKLLIRYINTVQVKNIIFLIKLNILPKLNLEKICAALEERSDELTYLENKIQEEIEGFNFCEFIDKINSLY